MADMSLLQMSFSGAVFILVIIVIRAVMINRLPKRTFLILWGIVLIRLMVPVSVPSAVSVYSLLNRNVNIIALEDTPVGNIISGMPGLQADPNIVEFKSNLQLLQASGSGNSQIKLTSSPRAVERIQSVSVWFVIWCIGMTLCIIFFTGFYLSWYFRFQTALPVHNDYVEQWLGSHRLKRQIFVKQSDQVIAPLTYGVLHPVILLPKKTDWKNIEQLQYILLHEYVHIRRFDTITKLLTTLVLCIHWFNPFVWVMYIFFNRDMELSCDDNVVRLSGITSRSDYARVLIDMEARKSGLMPLCNNFSKNAIEQRITSIMKIKKTSLAAILIAVMLIVGLVAIFATSALSIDDENKSEALSDTASQGIEIDAQTDIISPDANAQILSNASSEENPQDNMESDNMPELSPQDKELIDRCIFNYNHNIYLGEVENEEIRMIITRTEDELSAAYITRSGEEEFFNGYVKKDSAGIVLNTNDGETLDGSISIDDNGFIGINLEGVLSGNNVAFTIRWETFFSIEGDDKNYYSFLGYDAEGVEQFAKQIKDSIDDKDAFAELIRYPISIKIDGDSFRIENEKEMIDIYDQLMEENGFRQQIKNIFTKYMFANYMGVCVEDGIIWFDSDTFGNYKITAINPPLPDDAKELEEVMTRFYTAFFKSDSEMMQHCLSESYTGKVFYMDDPDVFEKIEVFRIKGLDSDMHYDIGDIIILSVEFMLPDEDSFTYLTAELVKEISGWKVDWYGLEK